MKRESKNVRIVRAKSSQLNEVLDLLERSGLPLTETASEFFARLGFRPIPRLEVTSMVKQSVEFKTLCPDSATVMVKEIDS